MEIQKGHWDADMVRARAKKLDSFFTEGLRPARTETSRLCDGPVDSPGSSSFVAQEEEEEEENEEQEEELPDEADDDDDKEDADDNDDRND